MGIRKRQAEDGPGAAEAIGSFRRVRPLKRRSMLVLREAVSREGTVKQGGNTVSSVLVRDAQGRFLFFKEGIF